MGYVPVRCLLRQLLQERRKSQRSLSERTGISEQKISDYVNNRAIMKMGPAKTIATDLGIDIDDLYEFKWVD